MNTTFKAFGAAIKNYRYSFTPKVSQTSLCKKVNSKINKSSKTIKELLEGFLNSKIVKSEESESAVLVKDAIVDAEKEDVNNSNYLNSWNLLK